MATGLVAQDGMPDRLRLIGQILCNRWSSSMQMTAQVVCKRLVKCAAISQLDHDCLQRVACFCARRLIAAETAWRDTPSWRAISA